MTPIASRSPLFLRGCSFVLAAAALPAAADGGAPELSSTPDPVAFIDASQQVEKGLRRLIPGDFDRDGRPDVIALSHDSGPRLLSAPSQRLAREELTAEVVLAAAVQSLAAGDALVTAGVDGLKRWTYDATVGGFLAETVLAGSFVDVVEFRPADSPFDVVFALAADRRTVHLCVGALDGSWIAFDSFGHNDLVGALGAFDPFGTGSPQIVVTDSGGCAFYGLEGQLLFKLVRPGNSDAEHDRLVRLVDPGQPAERLVWLTQTADGLTGLWPIDRTLLAPPVELAGAYVGQVAAGDVDGDGRSDLVLPDASAKAFRVLVDRGLQAPTAPYAPGSEYDVALTALVGPTIAGGPRDGVCVADLDRDGDLDFAGSNEGEFYLTRGASVDHTKLAVTVNPASLVTTFDGAPVERNFELIVEQPVAWSGTADLSYRVWHRPIVTQPVELADEVVAEGHVSVVKWPAILELELLHDVEESDVWYVEFELVGANGLEPAKTVLLSPSMSSSLAWEADPGMPLWGLFAGGQTSTDAPERSPATRRRAGGSGGSQGGTSEGEGTTGSAGVGDPPRIPPSF